eukprot:1179297-Prorocentrum_minimum.AAC.1
MAAGCCRGPGQEAARAAEYGAHHCGCAAGERYSARHPPAPPPLPCAGGRGAGLVGARHAHRAPVPAAH